MKNDHSATLRVPLVIKVAQKPRHLVTAYSDEEREITASSFLFVLVNFRECSFFLYLLNFSFLHKPFKALNLIEQLPSLKPLAR